MLLRRSDMPPLYAYAIFCRFDMDMLAEALRAVDAAIDSAKIARAMLRSAALCARVYARQRGGARFEYMAVLRCF